jgi:6-pyruvoyltetrahydropterin/6-carboxytetrahydropterin synthase
MELRKTFRFEASHVLPRHPGKCSRLHGHSWVLHVCVEGIPDSYTGFVMDYADLSRVVKPLIAMLDHRHLGTYWQFPTLPSHNKVDIFTDDFYPTSENLLYAIGMWLTTSASFTWSKLELEETCTSHVSLTREEFDKRL